MGNCCGGISEGPHTKYWNKYRAEFQAVGLVEKDVKAMHFIFRYVETATVNPDGHILTESVLDYFPDKLSKHLFLQKAFSIYSPDDRLSFKQFVFALYNFCSLSHLCLVRFAFDLYNPHKKTKLTASELKKLIQELHGPIPDDDEKRYIIMDVARTKLDTFQDDDYTVTNFVDFCHLHHPAFSPMYDIQEKYQRHILGLKYWLDKSTWRESSKYKFKSIEVLVDNFENFGAVKIQQTQPIGGNSELSLGDDKPKLTLKTAHAQVHPTDSNMHRRGSKDAIEVPHNIPTRRGSKERLDVIINAPKQQTHVEYTGFDHVALPKKKDVHHLQVETNYKSVASIEKRKKSYVQDYEKVEEDDHNKHGHNSVHNESHPRTSGHHDSNQHHSGQHDSHHGQRRNSKEKL